MEKKLYLYCCVFTYAATGEGYDFFAAILHAESEEEVREKFYKLYCQEEKYNPEFDWFNLGVSILPVKEIVDYGEDYAKEYNMLLDKQEFYEQTDLSYELSQPQIERLYNLINHGGIVGGDFVYKIHYNLS